jgi:hypothetical protein
VYAESSENGNHDSCGVSLFVHVNLFRQAGDVELRLIHVVVTLLIYASKLRTLKNS